MMNMLADESSDNMINFAMTVIKYFDSPAGVYASFRGISVGNARFLRVIAITKILEKKSLQEPFEYSRKTISREIGLLPRRLEKYVDELVYHGALVKMSSKKNPNVHRVKYTSMLVEMIYCFVNNENERA